MQMRAPLGPYRVERYGGGGRKCPLPPGEWLLSHLIGLVCESLSEFSYFCLRCGEHFACITSFSPNLNPARRTLFLRPKDMKQPPKN